MNVVTPGHDTRVCALGFLPTFLAFPPYLVSPLRLAAGRAAALCFSSHVFGFPAVVVSRRCACGGLGPLRGAVGCGDGPERVGVRTASLYVR
ncbi:hypothetical protein, partial [Streptomyces decoyicus]|uniref:hypothetical protein n=1 Tax=Streptomyces decoyicus TaxID=249567 RepID=UPI0033BE5916